VKVIEEGESFAIEPDRLTLGTYAKTNGIIDYGDLQPETISMDFH
jgi:hypothetical protein